MLLILNDIAGSEIVLILVFILIFFGSKSIPGLAKTLGKTIRQVKDASAEIQSEIKKSADGMKGDMNLDAIIKDTAEDIRRPLDQYAQDIDDTMKYTPPNKNSTLNAEEIEEAEDLNSSEEPDAVVDSNPTKSTEQSNNEGVPEEVKMGDSTPESSEDQD